MLVQKPRKHAAVNIWPVVSLDEAFKINIPTTPEGWKELDKFKKRDANDLVAELGPEGFRKWLDESPTVCLHRKEGRIVSLRTLAINYKEMRQPIIHDLLRRSETMNIIAPPKSNKSMLVGNLVMNIIGGGQLFGKFQCERGRVLVVDNELHCETIVQRSKEIAEAMNVPFNRAERLIDYLPLRGELTSLDDLERDFGAIRPRQYAVIILDAFYKFYPPKFDENSNSEMATLYNKLDRYADCLECAFVLIHHSSKGNSATKSVTDMGAGAGSQSRACDAHMVLRQHQNPGTFVIDVANRSFKPIETFCAKFRFPVWELDENADPTALLGAKEDGFGARSVGGQTDVDPFAGEGQKLDAVLARIKKAVTVRDILGLGSDLGIRGWKRDKVLKRLIPQWLKDGKIFVIDQGKGNAATTYGLTKYDMTTPSDEDREYDQTEDTNTPDVE